MEQLGFSMNAEMSPVATAAGADVGCNQAVRGQVPGYGAAHREWSLARRESTGAVIECEAGCHESDAEIRQGNVTEVILPQGQVENFQLLLPMLTQLNQERRWLAWIDPPQALVSKWQNMHGIVASELLVLRSTRDYSAFDLAERALGAGTCHAVVVWTGRLSTRDFGALEQASGRGHSHGVILRSR